MAAVAFDKYGLTLTDNHLPMGCLDQGLDVLQIMRNIDIFVRRYNYNLNQQFFVVRPDWRRRGQRALAPTAPVSPPEQEKTVAGAKHVNTVSIFSISGSIRQARLGHDERRRGLTVLPVPLAALPTVFAGSGGRGGA